ncbi:hypothetical protein HJG60_010360 [Phyllostomus discolor]|uniref:Uncharacterized protein n=1 Tax=Phyllostomus discolor TaxID=89673 RepID=A0A834AYB1_9CHIR|nr:hypothetical protein HJG60_010360 [Phyllostomus discolor]
MGLALHVSRLRSLPPGISSAEGKRVLVAGGRRSPVGAKGARGQWGQREGLGQRERSRQRCLAAGDKDRGRKHLPAQSWPPQCWVPEQPSLPVPAPPFSLDPPINVTGCRWQQAHWMAGSLTWEAGSCPPPSVCLVRGSSFWTALHPSPAEGESPAFVVDHVGTWGPCQHR